MLRLILSLLERRVVDQFEMVRSNSLTLAAGGMTVTACGFALLIDRSETGCRGENARACHQLRIHKFGEM